MSLFPDIGLVNLYTRMSLLLVLLSPPSPLLLSSSPPLLLSSSPPLLLSSCPPVLLSSCPPVLLSSSPPSLFHYSIPLLVCRERWIPHRMKGASAGHSCHVPPPPPPHIHLSCRHMKEAEYPYITTYSFLASSSPLPHPLRLFYHICSFIPIEISHSFPSLANDPLSPHQRLPIPHSTPPLPPSPLPSSPSFLPSLPSPPLLCLY